MPKVKIRNKSLQIWGFKCVPFKKESCKRSLIKVNVEEN